MKTFKPQAKKFKSSPAPRKNADLEAAAAAGGSEVLSGFRHGACLTLIPAPPSGEVFVGCFGACRVCSGFPSYFMGFREHSYSHFSPKLV